MHHNPSSEEVLVEQSQLAIREGGVVVDKPIGDRVSCITIRVNVLDCTTGL